MAEIIMMLASTAVILIVFGVPRRDLGAVVLVPILVSPFALPSLLSDTIVKAAIAGGIVLVMARLRPLNVGVVVFVTVVVTALLFATLSSSSTGAMGLTPGVSIRSWAGYLLPWMILLIRWPEHSVLRTLSYISLTAPTAVSLGILLQAVGIWPMFNTNLYGGAIRLQGSLIPPHLAMLALCGVFAGAVIMRYRRSKWVLVVLVINVAIVVASLTRGAILATFVFCLIYGLIGGRHYAMIGARAQRRARVLAVASLIAIAVAIPEIIARSIGNSYEGTINTSGRTEAWEFYSSFLSGHMALGRGIGFATIANATYNPVGVQQAFSVPHNEYLHFLLDGGLVLLSATILALGFLLLKVGSRSGIAGPGYAVALGASIAVYSYVENVFSTPQFTVPFMLLCASLLTAARVESFGARQREDQHSPTRAPAIAI
jgi:teichuronic acid biosynthesis protein TuaE